MMRRNSRFGASRLLAAAGAFALAAALSGCLGYDGDFDRGYQVDAQTLDQIEVGKTTSRKRFADGNAVDHLDVGGDAWYYIGQKMQRQLAFMPAKMTDQTVLAVYFDTTGKCRASPNTA